MVCGPWVGLSSRHYITKLGRKILWLYRTFVPYAHNSQSFYNKIWSKLGLQAPKHALGGFHAQQTPDTNIMTHTWVTLSARRSLRGVPRTVLELRQGQQHTELLLAGSTTYVVLRPLCQECFSALVPTSLSCVWACLQFLLWWWRPHQFKAECAPWGLLPWVVLHPPALSTL